MKYSEVIKKYSYIVSKYSPVIEEKLKHHFLRILQLEKFLEEDSETIPKIERLEAELETTQLVTLEQIEGFVASMHKDLDSKIVEILAGEIFDGCIKAIEEKSKK